MNRLWLMIMSLLLILLLLIVISSGYCTKSINGVESNTNIALSEDTSDDDYMLLFMF